MKKFLLVLMALCLTFAMTSCGGDDDPTPPPGPGPGTDTVDITYNMNWPTDAGTAPAAPAKVTIAKNSGRLTAAQVGWTGTPPEGKLFGGWFTSKGAADGTNQTGRAGVNTSFPVNTELFARWTDIPTIDLSGKDVEKITIANNLYPVYQFTLPQGKTFGDYETVSLDVAVDAENYAKSIVGFRVYYGMKASDGSQANPGDFTYLTGTATGTAAGKKVAGGVSGSGNNPETNKNGPFIQSNDANGRTVEVLLGEGNTANKWVTLKHPAFSAMTPHGDNTGATKPAANATGIFYFAVGLPNITYWAKNITLVGKEGIEDVIGVPAYFSTQVPGVDTAPATYMVFNPIYNTPDGSNGFGDISREFVNPTGNSAPIPVSLYDASVSVVFEYHYPEDTLDQPDLADRTKRTGITGRLSDGDLATLSGDDVPKGWKHLGWFDAEEGGTKITTNTVFTAASTTIHGQWEEVTIVAPTRPLVINDPNVVAQGNNLTYDQDGKTWNVMATAAWAVEFMSGGNYGSLSTYAFPAEYELFLYDRIVITYETGEHPNYVDGLKDGIIKNGFGEWSMDYDGGTPPVGSTYPTFAASGTLTLDPRNLQNIKDGGPYGGFSIQINNNGNAGNGKANGWLIRFTKIEFTTQDLIDAGPIVRPEGIPVELLGNSTADGNITLHPGNIIEVNNFKTRTNLGFTFELPDGWEDATKINVNYDITFTAANGKLVKLTTKVGNTMNVDTNPAQYGDDITIEGAGTREVTIASLKNGEAWLGDIDTNNHLTLQVNTWGDAGLDLVMHFEIIITSVTLD